MWRHVGSVFLVHDRTPSTPLNPFRFLTTAPAQFSSAWRKGFVIVVSDLYSSSLLSSTSDKWASISSDESPISCNSDRVLRCADSRILNLYRLS